MIDLLYEKLGIDPSSLEGLTEEKANEIIGNIESGFKSKILENEDFYKAKISFFNNYCFAVVD